MAPRRRRSSALAELDTDDLLDLKTVASMLHLTASGTDLDDQPPASGLPAAVQDPPPARSGHRPHRRSLRQPAEDHARHHRRPRRRRRRRARRGRGRSRKACPAWPRPASSTATTDPHARRAALGHTCRTVPSRRCGPGARGGRRLRHRRLAAAVRRHGGAARPRARVGGDRGGAVPGARGHPDCGPARDRARARRRAPGRRPGGRGRRARGRAGWDDRLLHGRHVHAEGRGSGRFDQAPRSTG